MEGIQPGVKVIGLYQLVPLPAATTATTTTTPSSSSPAAINDASAFPLIAMDGSNEHSHIQTADQTYLVLPLTTDTFHSTSLPESCYLPDASVAIAAPNDESANGPVIPAAVRHSCEFCVSHFTSADELLAHHRREHSTNPSDRPTVTMCIVCGRNFPSEIHLEFHMTADHKGCRPYRCEFCARKYANLTSLDVHILENHPNKLTPYACTSCMASFAIKTELVAHLHAEHRQKYVCQFCLKNFRNDRQLKRHERTHTGPMQMSSVPANNGQTMAASAAELIAMVANDVSQMNVSTGKGGDRDDEADEEDGLDNIPIPNIFRCPLCDETFLERSNQTRHMLIHSDEGPFECPDCGNLFQDIEMFQGHMLEHDGNTIQMQQDADAIGSINYDDLHHNIDSLLNNDEFHDFDEDHNYEEIMTNLSVSTEKLEPTTMISAEDVARNNEPKVLLDKSGAPAQAAAEQMPNPYSAEPAASACHSQVVPLEDPLENDQSLVNEAFLQPNECQQNVYTFTASNISIEVLVDKSGALAQEPAEQMPNTYATEPAASACQSQVLTLEDPLENDQSLATLSFIQPNKRPPVSVAWQQSDAKERNFECTECQRTFTQARILTLHRNRAHLGIKPYICSHCGWKFAQSSDLIKHTRTHTGEKPYTCDYCKTSFAVKRNLQTHMESHVKDPSTCTYCSQTFRIEDNLKNHLKKHEGPNAVECTECGIPYVNDRDMQIHMKKQHFQPIAKSCDVCGNIFERSYDLRIHMMLHTGERPFKCSKCTKTFSQATSLRNHLLAIHSGERNFQCHECGKDFALQGNLNAHMRIHSNKRHFVCKICSKTFSRYSSLMEHQKIHLGKKDFKCDQCGKAFINSSAYVKHRLTHTHIRMHRCEVCHQDFVQKTHLTNHMHVHSNKKRKIHLFSKKRFQCKRCDKSYSHSSSLAKHTKRCVTTNYSVRNILPKMEDDEMEIDETAANLHVHFAENNVDGVSSSQIVYTFTTSDIEQLSSEDYQPIVQIEPLAHDSNAFA